MGASAVTEAGAGIGLRFAHLDELVTMALAQDRAVMPGWLEVHSENLFDLPPEQHERLLALRAVSRLSLHGVGLSLGSAEGVDRRHLERLGLAVRRYEPHLVSEHLCWNRSGGTSVPDLLPLPFTQEALSILCRNVHEVQDSLGRSIGLENLSAYARWQHDEMDEATFFGELVRRTGCSVLLDLNNLHVNKLNLGEDPLQLVGGLPIGSVSEIHLAGATEVSGAWIDTHGAPVAEPVWALFRQALARHGPVPTIVEWDQDLPPLEVLLAEAARAQAELDDLRYRPIAPPCGLRRCA